MLASAPVHVLASTVVVVLFHKEKELVVDACHCPC